MRRPAAAEAITLQLAIKLPTNCAADTLMQGVVGYAAKLSLITGNQHYLDIKTVKRRNVDGDSEEARGETKTKLPSKGNNISLPKSEGWGWAITNLGCRIESGHWAIDALMSGCRCCFHWIELMLKSAYACEWVSALERHWIWCCCHHHTHAPETTKILRTKMKNRQCVELLMHK